VLNISVSNMIFTVINVLVLYLILKKFLFKRVKKVLDQRKSEIQAQLDNAQKLTADAEEMKKQYEYFKTAEDQEHTEMVDKARVDATQEYNRIIAGAQQQSDKIIAEARERAAREANEKLNAARDSITDMVVSAAEKISAGSDPVTANNNIYDLFVHNLDEQINAENGADGNTAQVSPAPANGSGNSGAATSETDGDK
jgi:F-type H+-transporting ATPase subunit b